MPEIRQEPDSERVAIKTNLGAARAWFVFDPDQGGYYTPGDAEREPLLEWPLYGGTDGS